MASAWTFRIGANRAEDGSGLSTSSNWPNQPSFPKRITIADATSSSTSSPASSSSSSSPIRDYGTKNTTSQDSSGNFNCGSDSNSRLQGPHETRSTWKMLKLVFGGLASVLGVGVFVIIGHVANDVAGPAIISSLIIAAVTSLLSGLCYAELQTRQSFIGESLYSCCYQALGEFPAFIVGWSLVLQYMSGMAASGRALSALLDYITGHKLHDLWLQRLGRIPVLDTPPDFVAFLFVLLTALPFGLGLRWPKRLNLILSGGTIAVAVLFVAIGAKHLDSKGWSAHGFLPYDTSGLLSGAAICICAFSGHYIMMDRIKSVKRPERCVPLVMGGTLTLCFVTYFAIATVLTLMVHHRKLESDVPLVQAFEIRDVNWARFVISAGEGIALIMTLLSLSHALYFSIVTLAVDGLIFRCFAKRFKATRSSLMSPLIFGSVAACCAVIFPMTSLLEVMSLSPLIVNTLLCNSVLHQRYQPNDPYGYEPLMMATSSNPGTPTRTTSPDAPSSSGNSPTRGNNCQELSGDSLKNSKIEIHINKQELFPFVKQTSLLKILDGSNEEDEEMMDEDEDDDEDKDFVNCQLKSRGNQGEVPLLDLPCSPLLDSDEQMTDSDYDDVSSDTDIDAIVEEYKEKLRVATLTSPGLSLSAHGSFRSGAHEIRYPTAATGRRVCISVIGLSVAFLLVSLILVLGNESLSQATPATVTLLCLILSFVVALLVIIVRQPQNLSIPNSPRRRGGGMSIKVFRVPLLPWIPAIAAFLNICLMANVLRKHWVPFIVWAVAGILIYFFYGVWNSAAAKQSQKVQAVEKIKLLPLPRQLFLSSVLPIHNQTLESTRRITQVDTILIAR